MKKKESELTVVMKAKDLCSYVMTVTQKSPKHFRYTFVSRLQNLSLEIIENIYRANDVYIGDRDLSAIRERLEYQRKAMTSIKLLTYIAMLSMEQGCILFRQYEQIAEMSYECRNLLGAWMKGDKKRSKLQ